MKHFVPLLVLVASGPLAGCGGSDGAVIGGDDAGAADDGATGRDATSDATSTSDAAPIDGGGDGTSSDSGPCVALASNATDVYVDKRYAGATSTGTAACPFTTILAGISAAASLTGSRTVHVAGAVPTLVYAESAPVAVNTNVTLLGDGPAKTKISASGTCGAGTCAVMVNGGGVVDGFTIVASTGDGIAAALTSPAPIVRNVAASGSMGNGILALGAIVLGPNIVVSNNGGQGVSSTGTGVVHVINGTNVFDSNGANGINLEGGATLQFDGGSAAGNRFNGIRFGATGSLATQTITGLVATGNASGVSAFGGQSIMLRSSSLLTNSNYGLFYSYAIGSVLDLGVANGLGANVFGGATVAKRNTKAGMYLCRSRGPATQVAAGDMFAACAPTQTTLAGCDVAPSAYTDVAYAPAVAGDPVAANPCSIGP